MKTASMRAVILVVLSLILVGMVGCGVLEKMSLNKNSGDKTSQVTKDTKQNAADQGLVDNLVPDANLAKNAVTKDQNGQAGNVKTEGQATSQKTEVVLYFATPDGSKLVAEKREIPSVTGIARKTVEELIKGPKNTDARKTIPDGTKLLDINIEKGLATLSFSKELHNKHIGGSSGEQTTLYSIVNTLTEFPTVKQVKLLIDGQVVETLAGHADITKPVERNNKIIKK